ncbi:MAG: hypothetical protein QOI63_532 [Thermoplasmata archaeon]|jgi:hypothetical protein|nr:hypothetical protein [Thermoplasmata archaeon]
MNAQAAKPDTAFRMTLQAQGLHRVLWHNATLSCSRASACPDSGKPWSRAVELRGTNWIQRLSYIDLASSSGSMEGSAWAWGLASGGRSLDATLDGGLRFPGAYVTGQCPANPCLDPKGKTLLADGKLRLLGLTPHPADSSMMQTRLDGTLRAAAFDESPISVKNWTFGAAAVGTATVAGALVIRWLVALFSRRRDGEDVLDQPARATLFRAIREHPGLVYRSLMDLTGLSDGATRHHLQKMLESGHIVARAHGRHLRYFENHGRYDDIWKSVAVLHDSELKRLYEWLLENPLVQQKSIVQHAKGWGSSATATKQRLQRLMEAGIVVTEYRQRNRHYSAVPA